MTSEPIPFAKVAISPVAYYQEAWSRVKDRYGLFFGICAVGLLLGSVAPFGLLLGPMMCGIYLCFRAQTQGEPIAFDLLFKGFDFFGEAFVASLMMVIASLAVMLPLMTVGLLAFFGMAFAGAAAGDAARDAAPAFGLMGCGLMIACFVLVILLSAFIGVLFAFAYPLIMDRRMKGLDAVKLSFQAARANLGGLILLALANALVNLVGVLCCYVGAFLVLPLTLGTHWICYERVFGMRESHS